MSDKKCRDCKYWTGNMTVIGRECRNPVNQEKWKKKALWKNGSATVSIKPPANRACKQFEVKE